MKKRVQFRTTEGRLISASDIDPIVSHEYAMRKAIELGETSLIAIDGKLNRRTDYTNILQRRLARQKS